MKTWPILIFIIISFCMSAHAQKKSATEIAKFSMANFRGQKSLYNDGWLIIPSTKNSLEYCQKMSINTAKEAWLETIDKLFKDSKEFKQAIKKNPEEFKKTINYFHQHGKKGRKWFNRKTKQIINQEYKYGKKSFRNAWEHVLLGTIHMKDLIHKDWKRLKTIPINYPTEVINDFKKMKKMISFLRSKKKTSIEVSWKKAFNKASFEWNKEYEKSAESENSLAALPHVIWGNLKAIWYGFFKPGTKEVIKKSEYAGKKSLKLIAKGIFFPVAGTLLITGRTIYSLGGVIYYSSKVGTRIISNTVASGLLASVGILSIAAVAPTWVGGKTVAAMNQVALTTVGGVAGTSEVATSVVVESTKLAGKFLYSFSKNTGKVLKETTISGVVLGYNALTQIPIQAFLTTLNGTAFLVYDGPRLLLAYAKGEVAGKNIAELPVGSVIDLKKLEEKGIKIKLLDVTDKTIHKILKNLPEDLREKK